MERLPYATTRRWSKLLAMKKLPVLLFALFFVFSTLAQDTISEIEVMFVQNAEKVQYKDGKLTLKHVSSTTYYFADRPYREFGHMTTENFVEDWGEGEDSFADDPPNAVLSIFGDDGVTEALIVLKNPVLSGHHLVYEVDLQKGEISPDAHGCTLFIDPAGKPVSPTSVAGVKRRKDRRTPAPGHH
jgi:hypothetical protein